MNEVARRRLGQFGGAEPRSNPSVKATNRPRPEAHPSIRAVNILARATSTLLHS